MSGNRRDHGAGIDWDSVRSRLARAQRAFDEALHPTPERAREIMDARAKTLAQAAPAMDPAGSTLDVFLFTLGRERYGIETRFVHEVVRPTSITPVPFVPDFVVGVTNVRGSVLAVFDLRRFLNVPEVGLTDLSRLIVLGMERGEFGLLADDAIGREDVPAADLLTGSEDQPTGSRPNVLGVTRDALVVLDGAALIADPRLTVDTGNGQGERT